MRKILAVLLFVSASAIAGPASVPDRDMSLAYQERFTNVYLGMNASEDALVRYMEAYFGQDFEMRRNNDGTTDLLNVVRRDGFIVYYQTVATFPSRG